MRAGNEGFVVLFKFESFSSEIVSNFVAKKGTLKLMRPNRHGGLSRWLGLLALNLLASGCASMSGQGSYQTILIQTEPPGASIFVEGQNVGSTPQFVDVRRSRRPQVEIESGTQKLQYSLATSYRWSKSFGWNLIFFFYAPIGWGIDLLTGAAWEIDPSPPIPVTLSLADLRREKSKKSVTLIAVAPPKADSLSLSDAGGEALENVLRDKFVAEKSLARILPFRQTLPLFIDGDYEFDAGETSSRYRLYSGLKADLVYESQIERTASGWVLSSRARSTQSTKVTQGPVFELGHDETGSRLFGQDLGLEPWWSRILPNTIGVDFVTETVNVELGGKVYQLEPSQGREWWAQGLEYLGAINISSTPDWRRSFGSRWKFSAVPSFRVSRKDVKAKNLPPPTNGQFIEREPEFRRWSLWGGYGLEIGFLVRRHFFYFDLIPVFNWSEVSWRQNSQTVSATRTTITAQVELGYTYVFDSNWIIRLFSRTQGENAEVWRDAFSARLGQGYQPTAASGVVSGLTLGYRFEPAGYRHSKN